MVHVVRAVAAPAAVKTPPRIYRADAQHTPMGTALRLRSRDFLARVFRDLLTAREAQGGETPLAVDRRFSYVESVRQFHKESDGMVLTRDCKLVRLDRL